MIMFYACVQTMPWGPLSATNMSPADSNDGPILWIRPGEQLVPTAELAIKGSAPKKGRRYFFYNESNYYSINYKFSAIYSCLVASIFKIICFY